MKINEMLDEMSGRIFERLDGMSDKILRKLSDKKSNKYARMFFECMVLADDCLKTLDESDDKQSDAASAINNDRWEDPQDPVSFHRSLSSSNHSAMLTPYTIEELSDMRLFKLHGFNIGFALKQKDGQFTEIVAVHNNEPGIRGIGKSLVKAAVRKGGRYLDHFDGFLSPLYSSSGFEEYSRSKYDPQYDPDGEFEKKYGRQDVIYRKYKDQ